MNMSTRFEYVQTQLLQAVSGLSLIDDFINGKWDGVPPENFMRALKDRCIGPHKVLERLEKVLQVLNGSALPPTGKRGVLDYDAPVVVVEE